MKVLNKPLVCSCGHAHATIPDDALFFKSEKLDAFVWAWECYCGESHFSRLTDYRDSVWLIDEDDGNEEAA